MKSEFNQRYSNGNIQTNKHNLLWISTKGEIPMVFKKKKKNEKIY